MDIEEAAKHLGVSTKTLRRWVSQGKLQARRIFGPNGPQFDFALADLEAIRQREKILYHPEVIPQATGEQEFGANEPSSPLSPTTLDDCGHDSPSFAPVEAISLLPTAIPKVLDILDKIANTLAGTLDRVDMDGRSSDHPGQHTLDNGEPPSLLTVEQVAHQLQVTPLKVRELLRKGKLRGIRGLARGWRIKREDIQQFIKEL